MKRDTSVSPSLLGIKRAAEVTGRLAGDGLVHFGGLKSLNLLGRTISLVSQ